ncbi:MAG TPA: cystathionine gamma-lyase [Alphaproteobacteria bacterium]|nr:cystathionine gamma-lyase [Alphaproteobacteria bacterium]
MTGRPLDALFAQLLHHHREPLQKGQSFGAPIVNTSIYHLPGAPEGPYQYGRYTNPTWEALEDALGLLEGAPAVVFPSGLAAVSAILCTQMQSGDRILVPADGYYAIRAFIETFLAPLGIVMETVPTAQYDARAYDGFRVVWFETPSNPGLAVCDLAREIPRARAAGALTVVDHTTATPLGLRPFAFGADFAVCSDTKAVSGHCDVLMGHVAARDPERLARIRTWRKLSGAIPGPFEAWLVLRGLETLEVRLARMSASAQIIAERLAAHQKVLSVTYPGLPSHPGHAIARDQMTSFGPVLGVTFASRDRAEAFIDGCSLLRAATSFGGVHSSAECRVRWGDAVAPGYVRLSVGIEPIEPLWAAMAASLAELPASP